MAIWGGESEDARPGFNSVNNGLIVKELESAILIDNVAYSDILSYAHDVRGRTDVAYKLNNADNVLDGVYKILGTQKDFKNLSDLELADFTEVIVPEVVNFGATVKDVIDLESSADLILMTGVLFQFRKVTNDWNLTGILRTK